MNGHHSIHVEALHTAYGVSHLTGMPRYNPMDHLSLPDTNPGRFQTDSTHAQDRPPRLPRMAADGPRTDYLKSCQVKCVTVSRHDSEYCTGPLPAMAIMAVTSAQPHTILSISTSAFPSQQHLILLR